MSETVNTRRLMAAMVWIVIIIMGAVAFKLFILPSNKIKLAEETGSASQYKTEVSIGIDSFSGYAILRSDILKDDLRKSGIKINFKDDKADCSKRMLALKNGEIQMAVFTIDAFINESLKISDLPGTIFLVIDETYGADGLVAYKSGVNNIQSLDSNASRIVVVPNSPSEFLARVCIASFNLPNLAPSWMIKADSPEAILKRIKGTNSSEQYAFGLWEPYLSRALEDPNMHILLDSSHLNGLLVDVLVVQRQFVRDHFDVVKKFTEAYLRTTYAYERQQDGLLQLIVADSKKTNGKALDSKDAARIVKGIRWKNTIENYAHFGIGEKSTNHAHIEDIIANIIDVLVSTGIIYDAGVIAPKVNLLYFDQILKELQSSSFHPAKRMNVISGINANDVNEEILREGSEVVALTESQWDTVIDVGQMRIPPLVFGRGSSKITIQSQRDLTDLAKNLEKFPEYYLQVEGAISNIGDVEQNTKLASERASAVVDLLKSAGIDSKRIRSITAISNNSSRFVSVRVGQVPY